MLVIVVSLFGDHRVRAESSLPLVVAVGEPGSASSVFGTALWALGQIIPEPRHYIGIEAVEVAESGDRLALLYAGQSDLAIVDGHVPTALADRIRAIMAFWPNGRPAVGAEPLQLLVHASVPEDIVYRITGMIFDNAAFFPTAHASIGVGSRRDAMVGLDVPIHAGASRYYRQAEPGSAPADPPIFAETAETASMSEGLVETAPSVAAGDGSPLARQLAAACRELAVRDALVHFRGHRLVSFCKDAGAIEIKSGRMPTM